MRTPEGTTIESDEDARRYLLSTVGLAAIPFNAFGSQSDAGWFRLSIGVVSVEQIQAVLPRLRQAIEALEPVGVGQ
jgi:aspartate aminotransferase